MATMGCTMKIDSWSVEYDHGNYRYSMTILGTYEEALQHADNLGLSDPNLVIGILPCEVEILREKDIN